MVDKEISFAISNYVRSAGYDVNGAILITSKDMLAINDLINRQQSAIDVYMQENDKLKTAYIQVSEDRNEIRKETEAEIEEWKKLVEVWETINERDKAKIEYLARSNNMSQRLLFDAYDSVKRLDKLNETIKAEAIKEFAERLKKEKYSVCAGHGMSECVVSVYDINNLVKEMVGK